MRVRKKEDAFFGDKRDIYVCKILKLLEYISELQNALGAKGTTRWDFPKHTQSFSKIEMYLLEKIRFIKEKSNKIIHHD